MKTLAQRNAKSRRRKKAAQQAGKMADGADIDLYADDLDQDFAQVLFSNLKFSTYPLHAFQFRHRFGQFLLNYQL